MEWNRSETIASSEHCESCQGNGRVSKGVPCDCVLRAIFKACFNRFKSCVRKDKGASTVKLERLGAGRSSHMMYGRKDEEYIADFHLTCKRTLTACLPVSASTEGMQLEARLLVWYLFSLRRYVGERSAPSLIANPLKPIRLELSLLSASQPIARLVPVIAHAVAVFGDEHKASHWLSMPLPVFENRAPSELFETEEGIALVEQTLTRIEHNMFS